MITAVGQLCGHNLLLVPSRSPIGRQQQGQLSLSQSLTSLCLCEKLSSSFAWDNAAVSLGLSSLGSQAAVKNNANGDGEPLCREINLQNRGLARTGLATNDTAVLFVFFFSFNSCRFYFLGKGQLERKHIHVKRDSWFVRFLWMLPINWFIMFSLSEVAPAPFLRLDINSENPFSATWLRFDPLCQ